MKTTVILKEQQFDIQQLALVQVDPVVCTYVQCPRLPTPTSCFSMVVHITIDRRKLPELTQYILTCRPQVGELKSTTGIDLTLSVGGTQKTLKESMRNNTQTKTGMGNRSQRKHWAAAAIDFFVFLSLALKMFPYKVTFFFFKSTGTTVTAPPAVCALHKNCCGSFFTNTNF